MIFVRRGNRETFLQSLQHLYERLRGFTIWLYVDRARWHKGPPLEEFLRTHPDCIWTTCLLTSRA